MKLITKYMTRNDCYKVGKKITPKGIMIHSTATPGVMASDWFRRWNKSYQAGEINRQVCVHSFLDDKEVYQYLPWNHRGWHAGGGANNTHISIEICEPGGFSYSAGSNMVGYSVSKNEAYFRKAWKNAVDLSVMLCQKYGLNEQDIIDHTEGHKKGIASNHADVRHWFPKHGESMDSFRSAVKAALHQESKTSGSTSGLSVGDIVEIASSATRYYPSGPTIPDWVSKNSYHKVTQIQSNGKGVIKGGQMCVLLGRKVDKETGKESTGIMSWIEKGALTVVGATSSETENTTEVTTNKNYYRVQVGAFSNKGNAEALLKKVKAAGFEGVIKKD